MISLLKILFILALLILLIVRKLDLGLAIFVVTLVLGWLFNMPLKLFWEGVPQSLLNYSTLQLAASLVLVLIFNDLWKESGQLKKVTDRIEHTFNDARVTVAIFPAIIGLMPIMGGAYVSAPLVEESSRRLVIGPERKTFLNYWFRHVWEYFLPTYPGVLLSATIYGCSIKAVVIHNFLLSAVAITGGVIWGLWGLKQKGRISQQGRDLSGYGGFIYAVLPLVVLLGLVLGLQLEMSPSLLVAIILCVVMYRIKMPTLWKICLKNINWPMLGIVLAVMYFKFAIEASGAMTQLTQDFQRIHVSTLGVAIVLPFLIGLLTGMTLPYVGITFPIIVSMSPALSLLPLAYASGYCGEMLSPMHLCFVMTRDYFKSNWAGVYQRLVPVTAMVFVASLGLYWFFR